MIKSNGKNERIKRRYFMYLKGPKRKNEQSVDVAARALDLFENYSKHKDLGQFHIEKAIAFKEFLATQVNGRTKRPLSKSTQFQTLSALRGFYIWLADQQGYRSRVRYSDADYFSLSLKDTAIAKADREILGPTIEQVQFVLSKMPIDTDLEKRDRALVAFTLLTGAQDNAIASLKLKHVDLDNWSIFQDAREVRTKASKTMATDFFPVGEDVLKIVADWVAFLKQERHWGLDDPVFPATKVGPGSDYRFQALGLERRCWKNAAQIRSIFRHAFEAAGLPYFNPHSFRNTLTRLGQQVCKTPEGFKIWSQNLGHEKVLTTFTSYGPVDRQRQREVMRGFCSAKASAGKVETTATLLQISSQLAKLIQTNAASDDAP